MLQIKSCLISFEFTKSIKRALGQQVFYRRKHLANVQNPPEQDFDYLALDCTRKHSAASILWDNFEITMSFVAVVVLTFDRYCDIK